MARFVSGDVIVFQFPFSDFSEGKKRPALVLASLEDSDLIVCQITSSKYDGRAVLLEATDFQQGSLSRASFVRPNKLFTVASSLVSYKAGSLKAAKLNEIVCHTVEILNPANK